MNDTYIDNTNSEYIVSDQVHGRVVQRQLYRLIANDDDDDDERLSRLRSVGRTCLDYCILEPALEDNVEQHTMCFVENDHSYILYLLVLLVEIHTQLNCSSRLYLDRV